MLLDVHFQKYSSITITGQVQLSGGKVFKDLSIQYYGKQLCYPLHRDLSTFQMTEAFPAIY